MLVAVNWFHFLDFTSELALSSGECSTLLSTHNFPVEVVVARPFCKLPIPEAFLIAEKLIRDGVQTEKHHWIQKLDHI